MWDDIWKCGLEAIEMSSDYLHPIGTHLYRFHSESISIASARSIHFNRFQYPSASHRARKSKMSLGHICGLSRIYFPTFARNLLQYFVVATNFSISKTNKKKLPAALFPLTSVEFRYWEYNLSFVYFTFLFIPSL